MSKNHLLNRRQTLQLSYLKEDEFGVWDDFIDQSPQATIYGKTWYLTTLQCPFKVLMVKDKGEIIGGIVLAKNALKLYSNPFLCKYLGIYYKNFKGSTYNTETKRRKVAKLLLTELSKIQSFNYFFHPTFKNYLPFYLHQFSSQVFYTYWVDLQQSLDQIWAKAHGKLRTDIHFAQKKGYKIISDIDFDTFYTVCEKSFLRQKKKYPFSREFLRNYCTSLSKQQAFQSFAIKNENSQVMAVVGLVYDQHATSLLFNGIDSAIIERGANELLIFECIKFAQGHSVLFDFEGSMLASVDAFYRKFGGEQVPFYKVYKNNILNFGLTKGIEWYRKFKKWIGFAG